MRRPVSIAARVLARGRRAYLVVATVAVAVAVGLAGGSALSASSADGLSVTVDPATTSAAAGYVDLPHMTYAAASAAVQAGTDMVLPVVIAGLESFRVSQVAVAVDAGKRSVALRGRATLPGVGDGLDFLVSAVWADDASTSPAIALGAEAAGVNLSDLNPLWGAAFGPTPFDTARLVVSNRAQTLGPASLPDAVADFYADPLQVGPGVAFQGDLRATGRLGSVLGYAGYSGSVKLEGTLAGSAALLFGAATAAEQGALSVAATLRKSATAPAWIRDRTTTVTLDLTQGASGWAPAVTVDDDVTVTVADTTGRFAGHVGVAPTGAIDAQLALLGTFEAPFGLDRLQLDDVALEATYDAGALSGALTARATIAGASAPLQLRAELGSDTTGTTASLSIDGSVAVPDLVAFGGAYVQAKAASLPGADDVKLTAIEFSVEDRDAGAGPETDFSLTATTSVGSLQATALLSLRKTGTADMQPLLVLRLSDGACAPGPCITVSKLLGGAAIGGLGSLQLRELELVATTLSTLSTPLTHLTKAEADFFSAVYPELPAELTFSPGIDVEAKLPLSQLGGAGAALGFASDAAATLRGTLGSATLSELVDASAPPHDLSLSADLPPASGGSLPDWLTISRSRFVVSGDGTITAGIELDGKVAVGGTDNEFEGQLAYSGSDGLQGALKLVGDTFHAPFGLDKLALSGVELELSYGAGVFAGALTGDTAIDGRTTRLHLAAQLARSGGATTLSFAVDGPMTVGEVMSLSAKYLGTPRPSLLGAEDLKLDGIAFQREQRRTPDETVLTFTATATVRTLEATVLVSLRQAGSAPELQPLLGLQLVDPGCQPADCIRLSQLFAGTGLGNLVGDLQVPAVDLVVTSLPKLVRPTSGETRFFSSVYEQLPAELTFAKGIDLEAKLPLSKLGDELRAALGIRDDVDPTVTLRGTLGLGLKLSQLNGASVTLDGVSLEAVLPPVGGGSVLPRWLKLTRSSFSIASQQGAIGAGVVLDAQVTVDGKTNAFHGTLGYAGDGTLQGKLALVGGFKAPFDLDRLDVAQVAFEVRYDDGAFAGAIDAQVSVKGFDEKLLLSADLAKDDSGSDVYFEIDGSVTVPELVAFASDYLDAKVAPDALPGAGALALTKIGFELDRRQVEQVQETVFSLGASATLGPLQANVLLSLRKSGGAEVRPLLGLQLTDPGCAGCIRLSQLLGSTRLGPLVGSLAVPAVELVVTTLPTLTNPTRPEADFFGAVYDALPPVLTFSPGLDVEARLPLASVPAQARTLLGFGTGADLTLRGSLGADVTLGKLGSAGFTVTSASLAAELPPTGDGAQLPGWLTLDRALLSIASDHGAVISGVDLDGHTVLDGKRNHFHNVLAFGSDGGLQGKLALDGPYEAFGLQRLQLANVVVDASYAAGAFAGSLAFDASVVGLASPLHVHATLAKDVSERDVSFAVDGSLPVPRLLRFAEDYLGAAPVALPGTDGLALTGIAFEVERRTVGDVQESVFTLNASASLRALQADVLLSLRRSEGRPTVSLLGLRIADPGCRPGDCIRLSQLFRGTGVDPLVGDLTVPAADVVVASDLTRLTQPTEGEASFFADVSGGSASALRFSRGVNVAASLPVQLLPGPLQKLLALDPTGDAILSGRLGAAVDVSQLGATKLTSVDLSATLPTAGSSPLLPRWFSFNPNRPTILELRSAADGTIAASLEIHAEVRLGNRHVFPTFAAAYAKTGTATSIALRATLPNWTDPFGVRWLGVLYSPALEIGGTFDGAAAPQVTARLSSSTSPEAGPVFAIAATLSMTDSTSASITASYDGTTTLPEVAARFSLPASFGVAISTSGLDRLTIGPVAATANVAGSASSFSLSAGTTLALHSSQVPATVLVSAGPGGSRGTGAGSFTLAVKASRSLRVSELASSAPSVPLSLDGAALVLATSTAAVPSTSLDDVEFDFFKTIYGCSAASTRAECTPFTVHLTSGLSVAGSATLPQGVLALTKLIGLQLGGPIAFTGTIPFGSMHDLSLTAYVPSLHLDAANWLQAGQLAFTISPDGFKLGGTITVKLPSDDSFTFDVSTKIGFEPASFLLTGSMRTGPGGWHPGGLQWLAMKDLALQLGATSAGTTGPALTVGFGGTITVGSKDLAASALFETVAGDLVLQGVSARSTAGVTLTDLLALQAAVAGAAPLQIDTSKLPDLALRNVAFSWSEVTDEELCLKPGIRLNGDLVVGAGTGTPAADQPPGRCGAAIDDNPAPRGTCTKPACLATVFASVDAQRISAHGQLSGFTLGPLKLDDAEVGLDVSSSKQALHVVGGLKLGSFASGTVRVDQGPTTYHAVGNLLLPAGVHAYLFADAAVSANPSFSGRLVLRDDFAATFSNAVGGVVNAVKPLVSAVKSVVDLASGKADLRAFSNLGSVLTSVGVAVPPDVSKALGAIGDLQKGVDAIAKATGGILRPSFNLDAVLKGIDVTFPGLRGLKTPSFCAGFKIKGKCHGKTLGPYCTGVWDGSDCWAIKPLPFSIPGVCKVLGVSGGDCSFGGLVQRLFLKPLVSAVNTTTGLSLPVDNLGSALDTLSSTLSPKDLTVPPVALPCVEFDADLAQLAQLRGNVALRAQAKLFGKPLDLGVGWNFSGGGNVPAAVKAVFTQLLSPQHVDACQGAPSGQGDVLPGVSLTGGLSQSWVLEGGSVAFNGTFGATEESLYPTVRIDWGDGSQPTVVPAGTTQTFSRAHTYGDEKAKGTPTRVYTVSAAALDARGATAVDTVAVRNTPPAIADLTLSPSPANEGDVVTAAGHFSDRWAGERHQVAVDWGDGQPATKQQLAAGDGSFTATHSYADDRADPYVVTVAVTDDDGGRDDQTARVRVANVAPQVTSIQPDQLVVDDQGTTAPYPGRVDEGSLVVYRISFTEPGALDKLGATVDWGDGSDAVSVPVPADARSLLVAHAYDDNGTYNVAATIVDNDGGKGSATLAQQVANVAPTVDVTYTVNGQTLDLNGVVYDPSPVDSLSVRISWRSRGADATFDLNPAQVEWTAEYVMHSVDVHPQVWVMDDDGGVGYALPHQ